MKNHLLISFILAVIGLNVNAQTQLITNGNFSSSSGWTTSGNWYITTTKTCYNNSSGYAYAGDANGYAVNNETGDLKQTVTIPSTATSATLTFYASKSTDEVTTTEVFDYVNVFLLNSSGSQLVQFSPTNINNLYAGKPSTLCDGYSPKSFSIPTTYFGQPVQVVFRVHTDGAKFTMFRIDDVSLTYIGGCSTPSNPANPTSNSPQAGSVTITRAGSPPSGVTWYWQGTSCGTSTSLGSGTTYTATSSGTYYIKAYNNTGGCWSTGCGSVNVSVTASCTTPSTPGNSTSNSPQEGSVTITRAGSPPSGVTWYWQGTSCGTSTSLGSGTTYTATSSGTYYIRAYNTTGGCWSTNCSSVSVSVTTPCTAPSTPGNPTSNSPQSGSVTITRSGSPPSGVTWYWQGTTCGTSTSLGSGTTYTATSSGTYYIRAYNTTGGCWSANCGSVSVTINSTSISGIDVSHYQGTINWPQVSATGKVFAYIKATQGYTNDANDTYFSQNVTPAINSGLKIGAYHVAMPANYSSLNEATHFLNTAGSYIGAGYLPPVLDLESLYGLSTLVVAQWVNAWSTQIYSSKGVWPLLYIARCDAGSLYPYYQNGTINANIKLWIADTDHSAGSPGNANVCSSTPWVGWPWIFHQYSWTGVVSGITENVVDLDVFNGDQTAFNSLIGGTPIATPPNDNPCDAEVPTLTVGTSCSLLPGSNVGATNSSVPNENCDGTTCNGDVWYKFIVPASGHVIINTKNGTLDDMGMALYTGTSCSSLTYYKCYKNGSSYSQYMPYADVSGLNPGSTIWIRLWDYLSDEVGTFSICVTTTTTSPDIEVNPSSISINQSGASSVKSPSYVLFDNSKNNPINNEIKDQIKLTEHLMGCIIPDSIVEYWKTNKSFVKSSVFPSVALPAAIDWSINDSPVKDQGGCGSCWAFAVTAYIENLGSQSDLSEQVVLSCSGAGNCSTGYFDQALQFFKSTGVPAESCYTYTGTNGSCSNMCSTPDFKEKITTVSNTLWGLATVDILKTYLQSGPLIVRMLVPTGRSFNPDYPGGIYNYEGGPISSETQGHAVLLVGYDENNQCFKAKNSWAPGWGENGYFRISYDDVTDDVQFGSYAITGSMVYTQNLSSNSFAIANIGNGNLSINSITDNKNWLSTSGCPATPFNIAEGGSQTLNVSVDWSLVGTSSQTGMITIASNDSDEPSVTVQVTAVPTITPTLTVTPTSLTLGSASNSNDQINISSNVSWTVSDDASWLSASPASGSNNETVTVTATSANTSTNSLNGTVTISGSGITRTVSVTQIGVTLTPVLTVAPTSLTLGAASNSNSQISVSSNISWTASDDASWLSVAPTSGSNDGTVTVSSTTANTSKSPRNGTVTISGSGITQTVSVIQSGNDDCQPNWALVTSTNTTTAYCKVTIKDIPASSNDKLAAFVGNECRGIGNIVINNNEAYSTIMIQGTSPETVSFRIWDFSECSELKACGAFTTNPGGTVGNPPNYLIVNVCTDKTQALNLISGWNLSSLYVNTNTKSPKEIFGASSCITQVKNMTKSWDPAVSDFLNTLQVLSKGEGYFIKTKNACNIEITGPYIGNDHSINLISGWNLIGYPYDICQSGTSGIKTLLDNNKLVQLKNMTQSYDPLVSDFLNTLKFLTPGEGYFLKASSSFNNLIISEPTVCTKSATIKEHSVCDWQFKGYEKSTIAYGEITLNDLPVTDDAYIGAFAGDECRSVMPLIQYDGKSYSSMVINGDEKEQIKFKLCVGGNVYESKTVFFTNPGESTQSIIPIPFSTYDEITKRPELAASPNPFSKNLEIKVRIFSKDDITVRIYSSESKLIKSFEVNNANPGSYKFDWDAKDFSGNTCVTGIYFIQLYGKTGSAALKVILDR